MNWIITPEQWKKNRDRLARRARHNMHLIEVNPGPKFQLRFDYILTAAEVTTLVESIMRDTERLVVFHLEREEKRRA